MQIEKQREEYYKQLGTPPGVPTTKGATADPDNTGIGYNSIITDLGDHSVPEGWIQHLNLLSNGVNQKVLIMPSRDMVMSQLIRQILRTSSSITLITSAALLILQMLRPISPSSMPTCHTESCWWMNIHHLRICHISSMVRN